VAAFIVIRVIVGVYKGNVELIQLRKYRLEKIALQEKSIWQELFDQ